MSYKLKLLLLVSLLGYQNTLLAAKRVALVIGNSNYLSLNTLATPRNDATAIAEKLNKLGFKLMSADGRLGNKAVLNVKEDQFSQQACSFCNDLVLLGIKKTLVPSRRVGMPFRRAAPVKKVPYMAQRARTAFPQSPWEREETQPSIQKLPMLIALQNPLYLDSFSFDQSSNNDKYLQHYQQFY
jgi:hypothetical protein